MTTAATYPATVRNFGSDVVDFTDTIIAIHVNYLRAEVIAIESTLGTLPLTSSGWVGTFDQTTTTWNTVRDRIANIEYGLHIAYAAKVPTGGTSGQVLVKNSSSDYDFSWTTGNFLPSQTGNGGYYLTTNGTTASWAAISALPSQTGNSGKFLTTNGTASSWATAVTTVTAGTGLTGGGNSSTVTVNLDTTSAYVVPSQSGNSGKFLTTNGSTASWATTTGETFNPLLLIGA